MLYLPHFTRSIVGRALLAWLFLRVATAFAMRAVAAAVGLAPSNPFRLSLPAALLVVLAVGLVGRVAARRRNHDTFLLTLGYGRARQLALYLAPAAFAEVVVALWMAG